MTVEKTDREVKVMARIRILAAIAIWSIFVFQVAPALASEAPKKAAKSAPGPTAPKKGSATEEEVIARFEQMVKKYQQFFSEPRLCYNKQEFPKSPTGFTYNAAKFMAVGNASYDISKTNSIISPFIGHCLMTLKEWTAKKCGNIKVTYSKTDTTTFGFDTLEAAKQAAANESCFEPDLIEEIRINFSFQGGKWVWKSAIRTKYNNDNIYISTALGNGVGVGYPLEDNKEWLILVEE